MAATLFVFGDLCVDIVAVPQSVPQAGEDATLERLDVTCGGAAFNCAIAAAKAGAQVQVIGLVGADEFGAMLIAQLRNAGVDTTLVQCKANARTGTVLSIASPDGERTLYSYRGVNAESYGSIADIAFKPGDGLYLSGYSLQQAGSRATAYELKRRARGNGVTCLVDPSFQSAASLANSDLEFLNGLDWITPNAREAELLTRSAEPDQAASILQALGVGSVAVTLGAQGCFIATATHRATMPAEPLSNVIHTTGAGDAFCGGLLAGLLDGCDPFEAARRATCAAAHALAHNRGK